MITEEKIRGALERMADRAPNAERVRARLAGRSRAVRTRRAVLLAGGAAAAAGVVGVPTVLAVRSRPLGGVDPLGLPAGGRLPLRYGVGWLPDGLVEDSRMVTMRDGSLDRMFRSWRPSAADRAQIDDPLARSQGVSLWLTAADEVVAGDRGSSGVTVNGQRGELHEDERGHRVVWPVGNGRVFVVQATMFDDSAVVAVGAAESVDVDPAAVLEPPVAPGWLPGQIDSAFYEVYAVAYYGDVQMGLTVGRDPFVQIRVSDTHTFGGSEVSQTRRETVRGWPVLVEYASGSWAAYATLDDDRQLVVVGGGGIGDDELLRVIEELHLRPRPDLGWLRGA